MHTIKDKEAMTLKESCVGWYIGGGIVARKGGM